MLVVDASVMLRMLIDPGGAGDRARARLAEDVDWSAPDHLVIEVISAVRGRWLGNQLTADEAHRGVQEFLRLTISLHPARPTVDRVWELRHHLTPCDAAYVATAERLDCPLVTADRRLAAAPGIRCEVEVLT